MKKLVPILLSLCLLFSFCITTSFASSSSLSLKFSSNSSSFSSKVSSFSYITVPSSSGSFSYYVSKPSFTYVCRFSLSQPSILSIPYSEKDYARIMAIASPHPPYNLAYYSYVNWYLLKSVRFSYKSSPSSSFSQYVSFSYPSDSLSSSPSSPLSVELPAGDIVAYLDISFSIITDVLSSSPPTDIPLFTLSLNDSNLSFSIPVTITPLSSSGGSPDYPSTPSTTETVYSPGSPLTISSTLSRQSFNWGVQSTSAGLPVDLSSTDYFSYPNVADTIPGPNSTGYFLHDGTALGVSEQCYIRQYFEVPLSPGYYKFTWQLPSNPVISYSGKVVSFAMSYPGVVDGYTSGAFSSGSPGDPVPPSGVSFNSDGYYYVSSQGRYTFYVDFPYLSTWESYVYSGSLYAEAPAAPVLIATPYTRETQTTEGEPIVPPQAPTDTTSDDSPKDNTNAVLSYLGLLYSNLKSDLQYSQNILVPFAGFPTSAFSGKPISIAQIVSVGFNVSTLWFSRLDQRLSLIADSLPSLSDIRSQMDGSLAPLTANSSAILTGISALTTSVEDKLDDIYNKIGGGSVTVPESELDKFVQLYMQKYGDDINIIENDLSETNATDTINDVINGWSGNGNFDSDLGIAAGNVESDDQSWGLWSETTNDAFNGDTDSWYDSFEERVGQW